MQKDLISEKGFLNFIKEFKDLSEVQKPYWVKEKRIAAEHGDRSENAEYISAKEQIRNIDKRLRFLNKIINNSSVINIDEIHHKKINFGSKVFLMDLNTNQRINYTIVGTHETNPNENYISIKSPLGKTLIGKELNDEFEFKINEYLYEYEVLLIEKGFK